MHETTGLRERKKAETRAAISKAVMALATERGLDVEKMPDEELARVFRAARDSSDALKPE
jgi:hypothetical protein